MPTYIAPLLASKRGGWRSRGITAESLEAACGSSVRTLRTASQIELRTCVVGAATRAPRAMDLEANILRGEEERGVEDAEADAGPKAKVEKHGTRDL